MRALLIGLATLALSAGAASAQVVFLNRDSRFEHIRDQAVLVSQKLHHFERGRKRFYYGRIGRLTPLVANSNPPNQAGERRAEKPI